MIQISRDICIKQAVNEIYEALGTLEPVEICKKLNIAIKEVDAEEFRGAFINVNGIKHIFINKGLKGFNRDFTLAHELFHALAHNEQELKEIRDSNNKDNRLEIQANDFAATLLLGDKAKYYIFLHKCELDHQIKRTLTKYIIRHWKSA